MLHPFAHRTGIIALASTSVAFALLGLLFGCGAASTGWGDFVDITGKAARCLLVNQGRCFAMDRLDPTCPQCF